MPKQKTHKGLARRIKVTARGKVLRTQAGKSHLMTGTSGKRSRSKRRRIPAGLRDQRLLLKQLH